jgi:amino acid transporter
VFEGGSTVSTLANDSHVAAVGTLLDLGLAASFTACAIASLTALARVVFTLGREGVLPVRMGRVDPQRKTPFTALGIAVLLTVAVPLGLVLGGFTPWQALQCLIVVAAAGYIVAYVMASASLPVFLRRIGEATWRADALAAIAAVGLAVLLVSYLVVTAPSQPLAVLLVGALALAAGLAYLLLRMTRARVLERAGLRDHATTSDLLGAP